MLFIWDTNSKRILYTVDDPVPEGAVERYHSLGLGCSVAPRILGLGAVPISSLYIDDNGEVQPRHVMEVEVSGRETWTADGVSELVISNVPEGTAIIIDGENVGTINDGTAEVTTLQAQRHQIELRHPQYVTAVLEETAQ